MDEKILKAEISMIQNKDFNPELYERQENELPVKFLSSYKKLKNE